MTEGAEVTTSSAQETQELGLRLGALTQRGDLLLLAGDLGTGKTTLAQGIAWGLDVQEYAHSPTFVLVHEYQGRLPLFHVDLYRLDDPLEVQDLAIDEYLTEGVCVVEWAEKALDQLPEEHLLIALTETGPDERRLSLSARGERHSRLLKTVLSKAASGPAARPNVRS